MYPDMNINKAYYVGTNTHSFKAGIPAEIVGVAWCEPMALNPRLCYHIRYSDSTEDFVPVSDTSNYKIISFNDILKGSFPYAERS